MNKVALITGGSRGIGLGIARNLANMNIDLAINGIRPQGSVQNIIDELKSFGVNVIYCQGNIASTNDRDHILAQVRDHFGKLNFLINNAGMAPRERRDLLTASEESFDEVMNTNLKGPYFLSQAAANWMIEQKKQDKEFQASIINICSMSSTVASVNRGEYCVSKAGMSMMTLLFASRLGEFDIPVYEIRPGVIDTDMTAAVKEKYDKLIDQGLCVQKRWGQPEDVGKAVSSLVAGNFPYSTGQVIMVDGGLTIPRL